MHTHTHTHTCNFTQNKSSPECPLTDSNTQLQIDTERGMPSLHLASALPHLMAQLLQKASNLNGAQGLNGHSCQGVYSQVLSWCTRSTSSPRPCQPQLQHCWWHGSGKTGPGIWRSRVPHYWRAILHGIIITHLVTCHLCFPDLMVPALKGCMLWPSQLCHYWHHDNNDAHHSSYR